MQIQRGETQEDEDFHSLEQRRLAANPLFNLPQSPPTTPYNGNTNPLHGTDISRPSTAEEKWRYPVLRSQSLDSSSSGTWSEPDSDPVSEKEVDTKLSSSTEPEIDASAASSVDPPSTKPIKASTGWEAMKQRINMDLDRKTKPEAGVKSEISVMTEPLEQYDVASLSKFIVEKHIAARQAFRKTLA
jgi:hypothetical protein